MSLSKWKGRHLLKSSSLSSPSSSSLMTDCPAAMLSELANSESSFFLFSTLLSPFFPIPAFSCEAPFFCLLGFSCAPQ